ncbi:adhesion G-protein coupled receptor G2-like [Clytia hemisphaerica]
MVGIGVWEVPVTDEKDVFVIGGYSNKTSYVDIKIQKPSLDDTSIQSVMRIPSTALKERQNSYISSINYQNSGLFLTKNELNNLLDGNEIIETKGKKHNISNAQTSNIVDGNVFAVSIGETSISNLQQPITLLFRSQTELMANDTCKFWRFAHENDRHHGQWSDEGCHRITTTNITGFIKCQCDHLTNFALIINSDQEFYNPYAIQIVTYVGCGISIASLFVTLLVYVFFSKINRKLAPKLLICLSSSLLILLIIFIIGAERNAKTYHVCQLMAVLIHYFTLSTFCWMACESFNLYRNFINIFKRTRNENGILVKMSLFSWGVPLVIVVITMVTSLEEYGNAYVCVVHGFSFYYGVLLPVGLITLGNWIVLVLSLRGMRRAKILKRSRRKRDQENQQWLHFVRAATCATILGLTWTFGILAVGYLKTTFQWLFCIFNSLQGFAIFLLFVVNNKEAKREIYKWYKGERLNSDSAELSSTGKPASNF